ncbi:uncharacterized protein LOC123676292 isoform X3 [Harmonia axyridis]|uniref:uncharacterized protein LOC123676292 isoform X3 n=1 Tax=Harmonia axyridis TaxID=115357 RepID=UPI001E27588A|nr:uncharacterized protein LOC123676292 isoform X3 [Harmonia axyridis]
MSFLDDKQTTMGYGKENIAKITKHRNTGRNQEEDFVEVNRGRKRRFKNPEKNIGTGQQNKGISGQERKVWLYIYRVNRNTTTNMIEDYILTKEGFDKQTIMVKEIPSEENSLKRFVLTAPIAKKDEMYKPEFWPSGVGIKRFSFSKHKEFTQQDHLAITCRFNMIEDVTTKYKIITKHNVNEQSLEKFGIELSTVDWSELYQITDNEVDGISTSFTVIFSSEGSPELYEENGIYFVLSRFKFRSITYFLQKVPHALGLRLILFFKFFQVVFFSLFD